MQKLIIFIILAATSLTCMAAGKRRSVEQIKQSSSQQQNKYGNYDGIDVSSYQKDIDWEKVCADKRIKFVYIKATEGATYTSRHFEYNIENARRHGLKVGSYHFLRTTSSLKSQFENFKKSARREEQDLVPLIDFENKGSWNRKQIIDSLEAFAGMIREHYHCEPMIYTMTSFYNSYLSPFFDKYPLFIARYSASAPELKNNAQYLLWQYTDQGTVEGIDHTVDMCRFADGVKLRDILIKPEATKHDGSDMIEDAAGKRPKPKISTPGKFKSKASKELTKEEKKRLEKEAKEKLKEEKRQKKLRERARKDSIKIAKKRAEHRKDSIEKVKEQEKKQQESKAKDSEEQRKSKDRAASEQRKQVKSSGRGSSYNDQFPTRRKGE